MPRLSRVRTRPRLPRAARLLIGFALIGSMLPSASRAELTIGITRSALSLPVEVAQTRGFFAAEGVDVRVVDCESGTNCIKLLLDRRLALTATTELPVVNASFERNDFAVLATLGTSAGHIGMVGRKSAGIAQASDLVGKRIGVMVGSSSHYYLDAYLLFHGIDPRQTRLVPLTPQTIVAALVKGQIDALSGYPLHTSGALKSLGTDGRVLDAPRIYSENYVLVAGKHTIAQRPTELKKVLRALDRAERYIAEQPGVAKQLLTGRVQLDGAAVEALFPSLNYRLSLEQSLITTMEGESRWALREGHVGGGRKSPNYLDFIDSGPLRAAVPGAVSK